MDENVEESAPVVCEDALFHPTVELEASFSSSWFPIELTEFDSKFSFTMADDSPKLAFLGPFLVEEPA
jgi:hypothetical protein